MVMDGVGGKKNFFFVGGGRTNERPGTDHVTLGQMRGLKKTAPDGAEPQNLYD